MFPTFTYILVFEIPVQALQVFHSNKLWVRVTQWVCQAPSTISYSHKSWPILLRALQCVSQILQSAASRGTAMHDGNIRAPYELAHCNHIAQEAFVKNCNKILQRLFFYIAGNKQACLILKDDIVHGQLPQLLLWYDICNTWHAERRGVVSNAFRQSRRQT